MSLENQLIYELSDFGIECSAEKANKLINHLQLVIEKNKVMNLTRITDHSEAVTLHIVDSLLPLCLSSLSIDGSDSLLDMGTGAGFPGIPLSIMTGCESTLIDSVGKKVGAVREFVQKLGLSNVEASHARLEDYALERPCSYSRVIARAVAQSNVLIEYATPFMVEDAYLIVEKGRPSEEEIDSASGAASICGLSFVSRETFELPHGLGHREILLYQKTGHSKIKLPRHVGEAKKNPLGVL